MSFCVACNNAGCERCLDGPGEQGFSADEKELLLLRDRVRELERRMALEMVPNSIAAQAVASAIAAFREKLLDAVMNGVMGDPRVGEETEFIVRDVVRGLR